MAKDNYQGPEQYKPLGPWAYFGYTLLFNLPIAGFILLIIFSVKDDNINRRNFARSYWCVYVIAIIIAVLLMVTGIGASIGSSVANSI